MWRSCLLPISAMVIAPLLSGCTIHQGDFTVLSNKLVNTKEFDRSTAERVKGVTGTNEVQIIILFPTKGNVTLEETVDNALKKGNGNVMTDAVVRYWKWYIPYIGSSRS